RVRNTVGGPSIRSLARYVCVRGPEVDVVWNRIPARTPGPGGAAEEGNVLMLPWPLRIDAEDFKATGPVEHAEVDPYGFFEFAPGELLDLDLADRVLQSARDQEGPVEIVGPPRERAPSRRHRRARGAPHRSRRLAGRRRGAGATRPRRSLRGQLAASRRLVRGALVALPPKQAPPLVARRQPDRAVPPGRRALAGSALVAGDGGAPASRAA